MGYISIALQADKTAIFAPGKDPVIVIAIVSPCCKFDSSNKSITKALKLGLVVAILDSKNESSVDWIVVISEFFFPIKPVLYTSYGEISLS